MPATRFVWIGVFVMVAVVLFGAGLYLIGNQHRAFSHRVDFYTEFGNVSGIVKGAQVRVGGMVAGQVQGIQIPGSPAHKFRIGMQVDEKLRGLIRSDSVVSVETQGVVGDEFLLIHTGSDGEPEAEPGVTLASKEPVAMSKLLEQAGGIMTQVSGTITEVGGTIRQVNGTLGDVQRRMDGALGSVTRTVNNANGLVSDVRGGKGAAGVLLADPATAQQVREAVGNARDATVQLKDASAQVNGMLTEVQQRQMVAKVDQTIGNAQGATKQLEQASTRVNGTIGTALAQDQYGENAGTNLQQSLTNVNLATGNLADDTEALKHEFFFKGFFKHRGYNSLNDLPAGKYRERKVLGKLKKEREWLPASGLFQAGPNGREELSADGRAQIDGAVSRLGDLYSDPILVEGYAEQGTPADLLVESRRRAVLVRSYLQLYFHVEPKDTGVVALSATPPEGSGKTSWSGVCLVRLVGGK